MWALLTLILTVWSGWNPIFVLGRDSEAVVLYASSCQDLMELLENTPVKKRIYISRNLGCTRVNWPRSVLITNDTSIEGRKFGKGIPALDWSDSTNALIVGEGSTLTFANILLIQDFISIGSLKLSFLKGYSNSNINIMGVGVGIRSCRQSLDRLIPVLGNIPWPTTHDLEQKVTQIDQYAIYAESAAFSAPGDDNSIWTICQSLYQCRVNSPNQKDFQRNLIHETMNPFCGNSYEVRSPAGEIASGTRKGSSSNSTFAAIVALVASVLTAVILTTLFLILKFVVFPLFNGKSNKSEESGDKNKNTDENSQTPEYFRGHRPTRSRQTSSVSLLNSALQLTDIELGIPLGRGELSTVYKGYYNNRPLAVKVVDVEASELVNEEDDSIAIYVASHLFDFNVVETLLYQTHRVEDLYGSGTMHDMDPSRSRTPIDTLSSINEVRPYEVFQYRTFHVTEFCNLGTLSKAISDGSFHGLESTPRILNVLRSALDIARGMNYLHSAKIIHGQLRPNNVLLKGDALDARGFVCKVADFGSSHWRQSQQAIEATQGLHLAYRAPETLRRGVTEYGSDVYSFGMVLWTMLAGQKPYSGFDAAETSTSILEGIRPEIPPGTSRTIERLIKDCWHADTAARPPFSNIIDRVGKIISDRMRNEDGVDGTNQFRRRLYSTSEADTLHYGESVTTENGPLDTIEIHDSSSEYMSGSMSTTASAHIWEQFQNTTSPASTKSEDVLPSLDPTESRPPRRPCSSWDDSYNSAETSNQGSSDRATSTFVASKPSETVSLRYGIASENCDYSGSGG